MFTCTVIHFWFCKTNLKTKCTFAKFGKLLHVGTDYYTFKLVIPLKWQCHEIFWHFLFHESNPYGPLINRLKWFSVKIRFRGDIHEISDSTQTNTARSQEFFLHENPRLANTVPSPTPRRLTLRRVRKINFQKKILAKTARSQALAGAKKVFCFRISQSPGKLGSICRIFKIFSKFFRKFEIAWS